MKCCKSTGLSLPTELMERIDSERGDVPRSRFLLRLIEKAYEKDQRDTCKRGHWKERPALERLSRLHSNESQLSNQEVHANSQERGQRYDP